MSKTLQVIFAALGDERFADHQKARHVMCTAALLCLLFCANVSLAAPPKDILLTLSLADGQQQYRMGEIIPVQLTFTAAQGTNYSIDLANHDRSSSLNIDTFHASPDEGWSDPLAYYYNSGLFGSMGGGRRSIPKLGTKPVHIDADLNEWLRFDHPGHFRLTVTSHRVIKDRSSDGFGTYIDVTSNEIEFDIIAADKAWTRQQLAFALTSLQSEDQAISLRGAQIMRFLGTEDAAVAMVNQFDERENEHDEAYELGLIGSPHRKLVVETMTKALADANYLIPPSFLHALAALVFQEDHPEPIPTIPVLYSPKIDDTVLKNMIKEAKKRREAFKPYVTKYLVQLAASLPNRSGRSYGATLTTILIEGSEAGSLGKPEFAEFHEQLRKTLPSVFRQLPCGYQESLLDLWWEQIGSPVMVPVLRQMYDAAPNDVRSGKFIEYINKFDPKMARQMAMKDMKSSEPVLLYNSADVFGNEPLPAIEDILVRNLRQAARNNSPALYMLSILIAQHATARVLPSVKEIYRQLRRTQDPTVKEYLLVYFFRTDFNFARTTLQREFRICSASAKNCETMGADVFGLVLKRGPDARVLKLATDTLANADPYISSSAAEVLKDYGTPESEAVLWRRLQLWHEQWKGQTVALGEENNRPEAELGAKLIEAIMQGTGWLANKDKLTKLATYCITKKQCADVAEDRDHWKNGPQLEIDFSTSGQVWSRVAQYVYLSMDELWQKLAQFPAGSTLTYIPQFESDEKAEADATTAKVKQFAKEHGLILTIKSDD